MLLDDAAFFTMQSSINFPQSLRWRHNGCDSVSNNQPQHCLLNRLFRRRLKKTSKLRVTGLCAGNSPGTGEFSAQMASYAENVSIWWRHHGTQPALVQIMACLLYGTKPLYKQMSVYCESDRLEQISVKYFNQNTTIFSQENEFENANCKMPSFCLGLNMFRKSGQWW